jgi:predicted DNA-binding transcriptional regulator AlpA
MNSENSLSSARAASAAPSKTVSLSPWINERFPAWEDLLSAHDVARLTRRPRWMLTSMVLLRRFPRKRRYHGRGIGWLRSDVIHWLGKDLRAAHCLRGQALPRPVFVARQTSLPLECTEPCALRRGRGKRSVLTRRNAS